MIRYELPSDQRPKDKDIWFLTQGLNTPQASYSNLRECSCFANLSQELQKLVIKLYDQIVKIHSNHLKIDCLACG